MVLVKISRLIASLTIAGALLFHAAHLPPYTKAVAVVSGGNVAPELLAAILAESPSNQ